MAKKRLTTKKATYKISLDKLEVLNSKIKDLTKLNRSVFMKLNNENILLYSLVGKGVNIHSFKSHTQQIEDTFNVVKDTLKVEMVSKAWSRRNII